MVRDQFLRVQIGFKSYVVGFVTARYVIVVFVCSQSELAPHTAAKCGANTITAFNSVPTKQIDILCDLPGEKKDDYI